MQCITNNSRQSQTLYFRYPIHVPMTSGKCCSIRFILFFSFFKRFFSLFIMDLECFVKGDDRREGEASIFAVEVVASTKGIHDACNPCC